MEVRQSNFQLEAGVLLGFPKAADFQVRKIPTVAIVITNAIYAGVSEGASLATERSGGVGLCAVRAVRAQPCCAALPAGLPLG